mgnify:CR=1 FL=1
MKKIDLKFISSSQFEGVGDKQGIQTLTKSDDGLVYGNITLKYEGGKENYVTTQLNLLNIGPAQILTIPGEALPNVGYYVKRNMNSKMPFLFGLTNDAFGYMLAKVDFNSFKRYEYVSRTSLGEMTAEIYMEQALKLVKESPKPQN